MSSVVALVEDKGTKKNTGVSSTSNTQLTSITVDVLRLAQDPEVDPRVYECGSCGSAIGVDLGCRGGEREVGWSLE